MDCANELQISRAVPQIAPSDEIGVNPGELPQVPNLLRVLDQSDRTEPSSARLHFGSDPDNASASVSEDSKILELVYTSAPHGLRPGSSGFCTVAMTEGMPAELVARLESLSSCDPVFFTGANSASASSVVMAHWRLPIAGRTRSVLSRIAFGGFDYTQRPNKLACHSVLPAGYLPRGGPAYAFMSPQWMIETWTGSPGYLSAGKNWPSDDPPARPCAAWKAAAGDAGWAGMLAETVLVDPSRISYLISAPGFDPIPLLQEALALLPLHIQWQVTFATHFSAVPVGLNCAWRCVVAGAPAAEKAFAHGATGLVIDLTRGPVPPPPECSAVRSARAGTKLVSEPMLRGAGSPP